MVRAAPSERRHSGLGHAVLMSTPIPQPLRAAAGLAALAIDNARKVPQQLVGLPVLAVSTALQASLKAQQAYAGLVARGDEVLGQLRGQQDDPPWARFDDDAPAGGRPPSAFDAAPEPGEDDDAAADLTDALIAEAGEDEELIEQVDRELDPDTEADVVSLAEAAAQREADDEDVLGELEEDEEAGADAALAEAGVTVTDFTAERSARVNGRQPGSGTEPGTDLPADGMALAADAAATEATLAADGYLPPEPPVTGYDQLSIPQLRGRLRSLTLGQVEALVAYERSNQARPPYLTMLENRATTLRSK
jgi:hypothetical protein